MTASALDFVQGRTTQALSGVCTDAQVARVLMRSSDNLAITMIGAAMLRGNAQLFADMLAELPAQQSLPMHCAAAFAPATTQEISLCHALHGESRMVFSLLQDAPAPHDRGWLERVGPQLLDGERTPGPVGADLYLGLQRAGCWQCWRRIRRYRKTAFRCPRPHR